MDLAAFSQPSAAGAHDPLRDCGINSIRLTAANATAAIARIAVLRMTLAFDSGRRNGQPWLKFFSLDQQVSPVASIFPDRGYRLLKAKAP